MRFAGFSGFLLRTLFTDPFFLALFVSALFSINVSCHRETFHVTIQLKKPVLDKGAVVARHRLARIWKKGGWIWTKNFPSELRVLRKW